MKVNSGAAARTALLSLALLAPCARAQTLPALDAPILDNSFLLEEAYNQEAGVVQHISSVSRFGKDWIFTFTQEWPVPGFPRHQLSFTAAAVRAGGFIGSGVGFGDTAIHYRYQLVGSGESRLAFSPRISVLLPSGKPRFGRGAGGTSVQAGLPFSIGLTSRLATHVNLGITHTPHARNEFGDRAPATAYTAAQSFVYTVHPRVNLMLETVWTNSADVVAPAVTRRSHDVLLSPGFRWSHNFASGLQIVPGVAVPVGVGPSAGERGLILYLSFEHSMWDEP
jgi:Putative MetA-pathway of phenol degradation